MKPGIRLSLAIAVLAFAALACQAVMGGPKSPPPTEVIVENTSVPVDTEVPLPTATEAPTSATGDNNVLLQDDFSSSSRSQWGTGTDTDSAVEYVDDALNIKLFTKNFVVWTYPNETEYQNVHMEVTAINNGTDPETAFGFFCNKQYPIDDSRYYFAITPAGEYAIAKAALAQDDVFLTNNDAWGKSDLIAKNAPSYRIGADCGNGKLTLFVDGQQVASVSDTTYTSGGIALFVWSSKTVNSVDVSFDDFVMTKLP